MDSRDIFSYAFGSIRLRKLRAALTILGIVIGITAIVALLSIGEGFQVGITSQFERGFALDVLTVTPGRGFGFGQGGAFGSSSGGSEFYLILNDTQAIKGVTGVKQSTALISKTVSVYSGTTTLPVSAVGINFVEYSEVYSTTFLTDSGSIPSNPANDTIIIGSRIADPWKNGTIIAKVGDDIALTWTTGPITKPITKRYTFHVAAVLREIGGFSISGPSDNQVYIPVSTAQTVFETDQIGQILIQTADTRQTTIDSVTKDIESLFDNKVTVISPKAMLGTFSSILSTIQLFLVALAGISLVVAGIGIMNIMIVSVIERTREIGILKALGMKNQTVLVIFLNEAALIGLLGSLIGIGLGWGLSNIVTRFGLAMMGGAAGGNGGAMRSFTITPVLTPTVFSGALAFGVATSILFGLYPARRASKLNPVDALRQE